jgi:hypothetical protein
MRFIILFICYSIFRTDPVTGQDESQSNNIISNIIEDFLESTDAENFDYNTIFENLNHYYENPLNINQATENDLRELYLLNEIQITDFIKHRTQFGSYLSIYELQSLPSWDMGVIKNVTPFLKCDVAPADFNLDFKDAIKNGTSTLFLKGKRVLEDRKDFCHPHQDLLLTLEIQIISMSDTGMNLDSFSKPVLRWKKTRVNRFLKITISMVLISIQCLRTLKISIRL